MTMFDNFPCYNYSDQNLHKQHFEVDGLGQDGYSNTDLMSQLESRGFHHHSYYYYCYYKNNISSEDAEDSADCNLLLGTTDLESIHHPIIMAEDESRTQSVNEEPEPEPGPGLGSSYSKDIIVTSTAAATTTVINVCDHRQDDVDDDDNKGWLQLSIGRGGATTVAHHNNGRGEDERGGGGRLGLVELDLLPPGPSSRHGRGGPQPPVEFRGPPLFPLTNSVATGVDAAAAAVGYFSAAAPSYFLQPQPDVINWAAIRPVMAIPPPLPPGVSGPSYSSSPFMYAPPQFSGSRFASRPPAAFPLLYAGVGGVAAAPSFDFRVIDPPRRPHSGIWFSLQASQNQAREPFLPQLPKSYLRIKDGSMTIRLVLKYLVNKLQLENESEIEITCRGQELPPYLTLQHVRDEIWMRNNNNNNNQQGHYGNFTMLPHPSTSATNHVMVLLYGRKSSSA